MTINLITQYEYDLLKSIQKDYPILTFQNNGYEYINKNMFSEMDKIAFDNIHNILAKAIVGFVRFDNFKLSKKGEIRIRFQYYWDERFAGVGYLDLITLLNGFEENELC